MEKPDREVSMREQLAQRLFEARYGKVDEGFTRYDGEASWMQDTEKLWCDVADECIRQMEWAYAKGHNDSGVTKIVPNAYLLSEAIPEHLTLAPDDWKP